MDGAGLGSLPKSGFPAAWPAIFQGAPRESALRYPSDETIRKRALIALDRAQALSRNRRYAADIAQLRAGLVDPGAGISTEEGWVWGDYTARTKGDRQAYRQALRDSQCAVEPAVAFNAAGFLTIRIEDLRLPDGRLTTATLPAIPSGRMARLLQKICDRSGLRVPVLPEGLKALTLADITDYSTAPLFVDMPGWTQRLRRGRPRMRSVVLRRLGRHRRAPPDAVGMRYADYWTVYDLLLLGKKEREVIATVWPQAKDAREFSFENSPIRQRVYDYRDRAKALIDRAYPDDTPPKQAPRPARPSKQAPP